MLQIDVADQLNITIKDIVAQRCAVLGASGSGKSNTLAVLIEEMAPHIPFVVVDPHGEYWGLREKLNVLIVGNSENVDLKLGIDKAAEIAEYSYKNGVSVILDLLLMDDEEARAEFVIEFFTRLWQLGIRHKKPYGVIVDEAHNFMPEGIRPPVKAIMKRFATEGRKFGFGLIVSTQTTTEISKTVLKQMGLLFLHRVYFPSDVKVYQQIVPLEPAETKAAINQLETGHALVVYANRTSIAQIRRRHTFHVGLTPEIGSELPKLRQIDAGLLTELQQMLQNGVEPDDELSQAQRRVAVLEKQLAERDQQMAEIQRKHEDEVELLKEKLEAVETVKLAVEQPPLPLSNGVMQVESIHAQTLEISEGQIEGGDDYRSPLVTTRAIAKQERGFTALMNDLKGLQPMQRRILNYLLNREDLSFTVNDLARYMGYDADSIRNRPPKSLMEMGLVQRTGPTGSYRYAAGKAREMLKQRFPDLDEEDLIKRLLTIK